MLKFSQKEFNKFIKNHQIIKISDQPFTLKSGKQSTIYVNWRSAAEDAFLMDELTDYVLDFVSDNKINVDTFFGVAEGATKLGILTQFKYARKNNFSKGSHYLAMGRAKPKAHGDPKDRYFVGKPQGNVCILEDVTTTGGSLIDCVHQLLKQDITISAAIGLTNRDEFRDDGKTVKEALADLEVPYYEMSNAKDLIVTY